MVSNNELKCVLGDVIIRNDNVMIVEDLLNDDHGNKVQDDKNIINVVKVEHDSLESVEIIIRDDNVMMLKIF